MKIFKIIAAVVNLLICVALIIAMFVLAANVATLSAYVITIALLWLLAGELPDTVADLHEVTTKK